MSVLRTHPSSSSTSMAVADDEDGVMKGSMVMETPGEEGATNAVLAAPAAAVPELTDVVKTAAIEGAEAEALKTTEAETIKEGDDDEEEVGMDIEADAIGRTAHSSQLTYLPFSPAVTVTYPLDLSIERETHLLTHVSTHVLTFSNPNTPPRSIYNTHFYNTLF